MVDRDNIARVAALLQSEQARAVTDESELRRLEVVVENLPWAKPPEESWSARAADPWLRLRWLLPTLAVAGVALLALLPRSALFYRAGSVVTAAGMKLATHENQSLPLQFSDGSVLTLAPESQAEVVALSAQGADLRLARGTVTAAVVHRQHTRWAVGAGPYVVNVTGTKFTATWDQRRARLHVAMHEGSVVVKGPLLAAQGMPLKQGQSLTIDVGEQKIALSSSDPTAAAAAFSPSPAPAPSENPQPEPAPIAPAEAPAVDSWKRWAQAAQPRAAMDAARAFGFERLCRVLPSSDLLLLADAARFADDRAAATYAFRALIERFPKDRRAGDAIFALGVLTLESEAEMPQAARRFEDYLSRWPDGPLAREAQGRLIEALWRAGNTAEARRAAANYQQRHPDGPHAGLAQRVLAGPP